MLWIVLALFVLFVAAFACMGGLVGSLYEDCLELLREHTRGSRGSK